MPSCLQRATEAAGHFTSPGLPRLQQTLYTCIDASNTGIDAVLSQLDEEGRERAIAFGSRVLSKPERQYCVIRRELLAVVTFTRHFRSFFLGHPFTPRTDHGSLTWLTNFKEPERQIARWLERLQELEFNIVHRQGNKHINADSLSRLPCGQCVRESHLQQTPIATTFLSVMKDFGQLQLDDATLGPVLRAKQQGQKPPASETKSTSEVLDDYFRSGIN